jgi:hypothetical protein
MKSRVEKKGRDSIGDFSVAMSILVVMSVVYGVGYLLIDQFHWIKLITWQAQAEHVDGVRFVTGASVMALIAMIPFAWVNR